MEEMLIALKLRREIEKTLLKTLTDNLFVKIRKVTRHIKAGLLREMKTKDN